ncbi:MAG: porin [Planktomarina sp.]
MKRILLTSTALVAFAGAAAAEVTFSGDSKFGYNDEVKSGVYYSFGATIKGSMELDNGLTASMSGDVSLGANGNTANSGTFGTNNIAVDDLVMSLASETAKITFGDTAPAADKMWSGAGNMQNDGFQDENDFVGDTAVLISEMSAGGADIAISYAIIDGNTNDKDLGQLQLGVKGSAGSLSYGLAYQTDGDNAALDAGGNAAEIMGVYVGTTFGGADVKLAYADKDGAGSSIGISAGYKVGDAVTVKVFYVAEGQSGVDDNMGLEVAYAAGPLSVDALYHDGADEDMQINFAYDMGNGLNLFGGYRDEGSASNDTYTYVGADYSLGGGAKLRVSYAKADTITAGKTPGGVAQDELGKSEDVLNGTTVEVSFKF